MDCLNIEGLIIPIVRTKRRKSVSIRINKAQAQVFAPMGVSRSFIQAFVVSKVAWIQKHLSAHQQRLAQAQKNQFKLHDGMSLRILGADYIVRLVPALQEKTLACGDSLLIRHAPKLNVEQAIFIGIRSYIFEQAAEKIANLVAHYTEHLGVAPKRISIKEYRSRWGSCNARKELQFNWLIALAPPQALTYVVVHELCHLIHFNHSAAFWSEVNRIMPDYLVWRRWFTRYGDRLWSILEHKPHAD
jgi:predicted metal-dependent hydrolase